MFSRTSVRGGTPKANVRRTGRYGKVPTIQLGMLGYFTHSYMYTCHMYMLYSRIDESECNCKIIQLYIYTYARWNLSPFTIVDCQRGLRPIYATVNLPNIIPQVTQGPHQKTMMSQKRRSYELRGIFLAFGIVVPMPATNISLVV